MFAVEPHVQSTSIMCVFTDFMHFIFIA